MYFLGLITRCKDEFFIKEFCDYYLLQGVDKIFVIDDNSNDKSIYKNIKNNRVEIIYAKNVVKNKNDDYNSYASNLYKKIKSHFKWMIYCDVDEFITTQKNITKTIKDELNTTFKDVDCIKIPWVMMSSNNIEKNPKSILLNNTYRWNHNNKHPHKIRKFRCRFNEIEVKCIFKTIKFDSIWDHHPRDNPGEVFIVDSINKQKQQLTCYYNNLREDDIKKGYLLCYHYRIVSKENCINKLKNNLWYIEKGYTIDDIMSSDYSEIMDETLKYKYMDDKLKFVHITKTSGTYIEKVGKQKNLNWGIHDRHLKMSKLPRESALSYWHLPLQFFNKYPYKKYTKLFTIVRNPYDRIISECLCKWGSKFAKKKIITKKDLNNYINQQVKKKIKLDLSFHHFLPQSLYTHNGKGEQIIDYIIKYEQINKFNDLMKKYSIDIKYIKNEKKREFTIKDISMENIKLINQIYDLDFRYYNYTRA
jgi:hypothetical protein